MKKRTLNEKELNDIIEHIKGAKCILLESDKGATVMGDIREVLAAFAEMAGHLHEKAGLDKKLVLEACKLGLGMDNMFDKEIDEDEINEEIDKKLEVIEKLADILKKLKEDK